MSSPIPSSGATAASPPSNGNQPLSLSGKERKKTSTSSKAGPMSTGQSGMGGLGGIGLGRGLTSVAMAQSGNASGSAGGGAADAGGYVATEEEEMGKGGKGKDLSHVPCRFFKAGACQAGASCPFSHSMAEPGQGRQVCQWFLKGNCRFGHKCALAHLQPGEPPIMDRKNKKAAQLAAQGKIVPESGSGSGSAGNNDIAQDEHAFPLPSAARSIQSPSKKGNTGRVGAPAAGGGPVGGPLASTSQQQHQQTLSQPAGKSYSDMAKGSNKAAPPVRGSLSMTKPIEGRGGGATPPSALETNGTADAIDSSPQTTPQATSSEWTRSTSTPGTAGPYPLYMQQQQQSGISQMMMPSPAPTLHPSDPYVTRPLTVPGPMASLRKPSYDSQYQQRPAPIGTPPTEVAFPTAGYISGSPFSAPGSRGLFSSNSFSDREAIPRPPLTSGISGGYPAESSVTNPGQVAGAKLFSSSVVGAEFGLMGRDIWGQRSFSARMPSTTSPPMAHAQPRGMGAAGLRPFGNDVRRYSEVFSLDDGEEDKRGGGVAILGAGVLAEDEDEGQGEEFLPSSLTELLTPRERARRLSRQDSNHQSGSVGISMGWTQPTSTTAQHVANAQNQPSPAASSSWDGRQGFDAGTVRQAQSAGPMIGAFLQGLWDEDDVGRVRSGIAGAVSGDAQRRPSARPSNLSPQHGGSFGFGSSGGGMTGTTLGAHSPSRPSPLHHFTQIGVGAGDSELGFIPGERHERSSALETLGGASNTSTGFLQPYAPLGIPPANQLSPLSSYANPHAQFLPSQTSNLAQQGFHHPPNHPPHPSNTLLHMHNQTLLRPTDEDGRDLVRPTDPAAQQQQSQVQFSLSPGTRALRSHAPGQSLPQGLAAGLSRLHLVPASKVVGVDRDREYGSKALQVGTKQKTEAVAGSRGVEQPGVSVDDVGSIGGQRGGPPPNMLHRNRSDGDEDDLFEMES